MAPRIPQHSVRSLTTTERTFVSGDGLTSPANLTLRAGCRWIMVIQRSMDLLLKINVSLRRRSTVVHPGVAGSLAIYSRVLIKV